MHVSRHVQIAAGLSPSIVKKLDRLGPKCLSVGQLLTIAKLCDEVSGEPDDKEQLELLQRFLTGPRRKYAPRPPGMLPLKKRVLIQFDKLANGRVHVPKKLRPAVDLIVAFLEGKVKNLTPKTEDE